MGIEGASFCLSFFFFPLLSIGCVDNIFKVVFSGVFFFPTLEVVLLVFFAVMYEMGIKDSSVFFPLLFEGGINNICKEVFSDFFFFLSSSFF